MEKLSRQENWKPWMAFVLEAIVLVLLYFVGSKMQMAWGLTGLITTELMLLALAIAATLFHETPFKEVFPIKKISVKEIFGLVIFAIAGMMINLILLGVSACLFPSSLGEAAAMSDFLFEDTNYIALILISAVLPAICEEALHRGAIISHLRSLKKDWIIILIMAVFFGLFHMSFLRFLSTAAMGAMISYVMVKKNNFMLPVLLHFANNFISSTIGSFSYTPEQSAEVANQLANISGLQLLGSYCVLGFLAPVLLVVADSLLCPKLHKKHWVITILISVALFVAGIVCTAVSMGL